MIRAILFFLIAIIFIRCENQKESRIDQSVMESLGSKYKQPYDSAASALRGQIEEDSSNLDAWLGLAETNVMLYIFGFTSRDNTIPEAQSALTQAEKLDTLNDEVYRMSGILNLLDWKWLEAKNDLQKSIQLNPGNLNARHWLSLYYSAMGDFEAAMAQSDTILTYEGGDGFLIGRGSLHYFARENEELQDLMLKVIESDPESPWAYDWLGMAYCELKDFEKSIDTYYQAFELSDGLAEVGGGLGHALGLAGEHKEARILADYYSKISNDTYVPPVQRAFIHIGLGEYNKSIALLEEAYKEKSWFIVFIQVEPWYDPIKKDSRFQDIIDRMEFPQSEKPVLTSE
jgi:tetratricopeptide (TPR) repeat protein